MPSSPGWPVGFVPSAAQWNAALATKLDYLPLGTVYAINSNTSPSSAYAGGSFFALAPLQFTLTQSSFMPTNLGFMVNAFGGSVSVVLGNPTDSLQGAVGGTLSIPMGDWAIFVTDALGNWWYSLSMNSGGGGGGGGSNLAASFRQLASTAIGTFALPQQPGTFLEWNGSANATAQLPTATASAGDIYILKNLSTGFVLSVEGSTGTIDGVSYVVLPNQNDTVRTAFGTSGNWLLW